MNRLYLSVAIVLIAGCGSSKFVQETQPPVAGYRIKYDHQALKIPGQKFAIGLVVANDGKPADTIGFPSKGGGWGPYHLEVDSGSYSGGDIKLRDSKAYKKGDSVTVNIYHRKSFLGGRGQFLTSRKIPYNFEDSIALMTDANSGRFPGGHIKFGVRSFYNNKQSTDRWYPLKKKDQGDFLLGFEGGHLSTKKGDWKIDPDPAKIQNDQVKLFATLAKAPALRDTLGLLLDYKANYQCNILSSDYGHELAVTVDAFDDSIIHAKLLSVEVEDIMTNRSYRYLINTEAGSINISSAGADGAKGDDGQNGYDGNAGADGAITQQAETTYDTAGNASTTYVNVQGPGGDGDNGGDGQDGGRGYGGSDGGNITVYYTPAAAGWLKMIAAKSIAGSGGYGGNGGLGGNGGGGGNGNPPGKSGQRGRNGNSGLNGQNGDAGTVRYLQR